MAEMTYSQLIHKIDLIITSNQQYGITAEQLNDLFKDFCDSFLLESAETKTPSFEEVDSEKGYKYGGTQVVGEQQLNIAECTTDTDPIVDFVAKVAIGELQEKLSLVLAVLSTHGLMAAPE